MYKQIKELGITTSLDMTIPDLAGSAGQLDWDGILRKVLPCVDLFVPSIEEVTFFVDRPLFEKRLIQAKGGDVVTAYEPADCTAIAEKLIAMGSKIILIKCGVRGLYLRTSQSVELPAVPNVDSWSNVEIWAPSFETARFASALGAGDSTIAGFLCGLIRDFSPEQALTIANIIGWQNVQTIDTLSGIKDWQSTLELVKDQAMSQNPPGLDSNIWQYSQSQRVYYGPNHRP